MRSGAQGELLKTLSSATIRRPIRLYGLLLRPRFLSSSPSLRHLRILWKLHSRLPRVGRVSLPVAETRFLGRFLDLGKSHYKLLSSKHLPLVHSGGCVRLGLAHVDYTC